MTSETFIHPTAVVEKGASLGAGVHIGPLCFVSEHAVIGDRTRLMGQLSVLDRTTLGADCLVHPTAVLGGPPQNTKHKGGPTTLVIGDNCTIREGVTMHRGTDDSRGETSVGANGNFLAYTHIAHDCVIGRNVTMANLATLGGHTEVGDFVNFGGFAAVHQFVQIGHHAFVAANAKVFGCVIPYGLVQGEDGALRGLNVVGMKRSGLSKATIHELRRAYRMIFDRARPMSENITEVEKQFAGSQVVEDVTGFLRNHGKRYLAVPSLKDKQTEDGDGDD